MYIFLKTKSLWITITEIFMVEFQLYNVAMLCDLIIDFNFLFLIKINQ